MTKATARLPGLDIDIVHRMSPEGDAEQVSIHLTASPSFEAVGAMFHAANPFMLWAEMMRLAWAPWLEAARAFPPLETGPKRPALPPRS
ncbi:MAG: hypothetical protein R3D30_07560 [Hyphomicrobiales bacterium]